MVAKLVAEDGDLKGLVFSLEEGDAWVIGRDPEECQLVVEDPLVSRKHAIVRRRPEGIFVENLSATNPVQVNDEEIGDQPRLLQQGDALKIGNEIFRYYEDSAAHVIVNEEPEIFDDELNAINEEPEIEPSPLEPPPLIAPPAPDLKPSPPEEESTASNTIFDDHDMELAPLAEINFGIAETGRWLLKVIGGPNNGAEFYMQAGHSYILGTDPHSCDIVFHDTSVSRQHARITVTPEDALLIEDLKSRNGTLIGGMPVETKQELVPNAIVTLGTTSFVIYDREGEMQTIISPLLPSIVKVLQQEEPIKVEAPAFTPAPSIQELTPPPEPISAPLPPKPARHLAPYVFFLIILGLFGLAALGTTALFKTEPVVVQEQENTNERIQQALSPFPAVRFSFNKNTGGLLLLGHVSTAADKSQLLYNLQGLKFIKSKDDNGLIIDDYVWQEVNSILANNPAWKGITIHSPSAGHFVLSGYLKTRKEAEQLSSYISLNFPYLDLLQKQIVVEEDVINQINAWLQEYNLTNVFPKMINGEITLTGAVNPDKVNDINELITKIKQIPGVRIVNNQVRSQATEMGLKNISDQYRVTGQSRIGDKYTVVINGRILSEKDSLDGMIITKITPNMVLLERDDVKYRIDY